MMEHKLLVELSEEELVDAPLLFLGCGHIFPRDSLDGLVELSAAYDTDNAGHWLAPRVLQVGDRQAGTSVQEQCNTHVLHLVALVFPGASA